MATINTIGLGLSGSSGALSFVGRNTNANIVVNSYVPGYTSTVTSVGTLTLTVASSQVQAFTGSTNNQSVELPNVTTLSLGQSYRLINRTASNPININLFGGGLLYSLEPNTEATFTCVSLTGNVATSWEISNQTIPNAVLLSPTTDQTISNGNLSLSAVGATLEATGLQAGFVTGSVGFPFLGLYPQAASAGTILFYASAITGNHEGDLTNANLTADRTWTLPDATGTFILDNTGVVLAPTGNQTILGTYSLIMDQGSYYATAGNYFAPAGYFFSGDGAVGGIAGTFIAYSPTANFGALQMIAVDSVANHVGTLSNSSLTADRTWSLPDATGTLALTSGLPITWAINSGTSITAAVASGYILTHVGAVTVTLPTTFAAGTQIGVAGGVSGNSWTISIPGGTNVSAYGASYTTSVASTNYSDNIVLLATVANTSWILLDTSSVSLTFT